MDPIKVFITRPVFTSMLVAVLVVFGLYSFPRMGVDQFPEVEFPVVTVTTVLPGADPETIERNVSERLEEALNTLAGIETLRSINVENVSQVVIQFKLDVPVDVAAQDVRDRVQATLSQLPREIETPVVEKFDIGAAPIASLAIRGNLPIDRLTQIADDVLKPKLQQVPGVGSVELFGDRKREISIVVDPARLRAFGLVATDVAQALAAQNIDIPGGRTAEAGRERSVKLVAEVTSVEEMRNLVVASPRGVPIRLRDVADVVDGPAEARSAARLKNETAISMTVKKQSGANTVRVAETLKEALGEINAQLPDGVKVTMVSDGSKFIRNSIGAVQEDLLLGALLAVVIVLVFLRNLRSTFIAALALPTSIIGTIAAMQWLGFTFNIVTMLALTLSIGLLIDDAIVVIENIVRRIEHGESPKDAAYLGTKQIALAVFAVTMAIVAVFVPVAFMEGIIGRFFYQFGITVAVAVIISYFVSMTLTPTLSARLLKHEENPGRISRGIERVLRWVERTYARILGGLLRFRALTMVGAVLTLVATFVLAGQLKFTFMPAQDMGQARVAVEMPIGSDVEQTRRVVQNIAAQIERIPGVHDTLASAGGGAQEAVHKGEVYVNLVPISGRTYSQQEFKEYVRKHVRVGKGVLLSVQDIQGVSGGGSRPQAVQFNLRSTDWNELLAAVEKTRKKMLENKGFVDVDTTYRAGKPQLDVRLDRERAAALGIPAAAVGQVLRSLLGGDKIGEYREKGETYDVKLKLPASVLADPTALGALQVRSAAGQLVEVRAVADIVPSEGPSQIERQAQMRQVTLLADLNDYSLGEAMTFMNDFAERELPKTVQHDFEGQGKELGRAALAFLLALVLGIVLVYIVLAMQFESLLHPFTIMTALPFAMIGAIGGLLIANQFLSMFAMIGIIMLMGLVTKNGILLVEFTNQLREEGKPTREALIEAGQVRLRPILMTTIAMIAGMIPVALAKGDGAETRVPMAVAIIGGLVTSTVLTLGVVPVIYSLLEGLRTRLTRKKIGQKVVVVEATE
jgi:hydrophobic/amphiphilic exporter-1 (mainly G- bacteria), HAE1 family